MLLKIALPLPMKILFDYLSEQTDKISVGDRVLVPFGNREFIGIVVRISSEVNKQQKLKLILKHLDRRPSFPFELFNLLQWMSRYYHHSQGECFFAALPKSLKQGKAEHLKQVSLWKIRDKEYAAKKNSTKQLKILSLLKQHPEGITQQALLNLVPQSQTVLKTLTGKKIIYAEDVVELPAVSLKRDKQPELNEEQKKAVAAVKNTSGFTPFVLDGITGSGKTEVYLQLVAHTLATGKQALVLVPEISLTPQFISRFQERLNQPIGVIHSSVAQQARNQNWLLAREGLISVVIGTRSAVLTPFKNLGLILVDEAHDSAYKQQDGLKYHAKHVALFRAKQNKIPIVLGSATPSLESIHFINTKKYQHLTLTKRAGNASPPAVRLVDSQGTKSAQSISTSLHIAIQNHLKAGNQVLLFLNRRGFAPVLVCKQCDWQASCRSCDAKLIVHKQKNNLQCHHCGYISRLITACPECQHTELNTIGAGTEQVANTVAALFPETPVLRIDRDTTQKVNAFAEMVDNVNTAKPMILVGTQMLAKGHDFHHITLVGVLDADHGLYSVDFRGTEVMAQLVTQVTGRAGRGDKKGEVVIQTNQPDHPFWQSLLKQGYWKTAQQILEERAQTNMPPYCHLILIRTETPTLEIGISLLQEMKEIMTPFLTKSTIVMGPVPAVMARRNGRYRAQVLLRASTKKALHILLDEALPEIEKLPGARKYRWSLDVDPIDLF